MFMIPEILWGDIIKIFKLSFLPIYKNIQLFTDKPLLAFLVITTEITSIFGIIYLINKKNLGVANKLKYIWNVILVIILVLLLVSIYLSYAMTQINF